VRRVLRHPLLWLGAFAAWFCTLWKLSSEVQHFPPGLDFQFSDKLIHFGYFLGGGFFFAAYLYRRNPAGPQWQRIIFFATLAAALTGALDEFHQSFVPGRSGNDLPDFTADLLGALAGALLLRVSRRLIA